MQRHVWVKKRKAKKVRRSPYYALAKAQPWQFVFSQHNGVPQHQPNSDFPTALLAPLEKLLHPPRKGTLTSGTCVWRAQEVKGDGCLYKPRHRQGAMGAAERSGISTSGGRKGKLGAKASAPLMHYRIQHSPDFFIQ